VPDHDFVGLEAKSTSEEVIGRAERTRKRTTAANFQMNGAPFVDVGIEVESWKWQGIEVFNSWRFGIANYLAVTTETNSRNVGHCAPGILTTQDRDQLWQ
jgi:hypothetical protein